MCKPNYMNYGLIIKQELLNEMHCATTSHKRLNRRMNHLVNNLPIDLKTMPADLDNSEFGVWFLGRSLQFKKFPELQNYIIKIELLYKELHPMYQQIFSIYSKEKKSSYLKTLLDINSSSVAKKDQKKGRQLLKHFEQLSNSMLIALDTLERNIAIHSNEKLLAFI